MATLADNKEIRIDLASEVGIRCLDSNKALNIFRKSILENYSPESTLKIILDLHDVRTINSSFAKALFGNLAYKLKSDFNDKVSIENAEPSIRAHIQSFIELGLNRP